MDFGYVASLKNLKNKSFGASEVTPKDRSRLIAYLCFKKINHDFTTKSYTSSPYPVKDRARHHRCEQRHQDHHGENFGAEDAHIVSDV